MQLDDNLMQLLRELGAAINDALEKSEDISKAIQGIRNAGYDVFLESRQQSALTKGPILSAKSQ